MLAEDDTSGQTICVPFDDTMVLDTAHIIRRHRSLDDISWPKTTAPAIQRRYLAQLAEHMQNLDRSANIEASLRTNFDSKRQQYHEASKKYRQIRSGYETATDPFRSRTEPIAADESIGKLRQLLIDERSLFESTAADVRRARKQLQEAQKSREECEQCLAASTRRWFFIPDMQPLSDRTAHSMRQQIQQQGTFELSAPLHSNLDSLIQHYHQKVAELRLLGEELADQNYDYWNEVARRELRRDQEDELSVSDSDFEANSKRQKEQITQELSKVIDEANRIREECILASKHGASLSEEDFPNLQSITLLDLGIDSQPGYEQSLQGALSGIPAEAYENAEVIRGDVPDNDSDLEVDADATGMITRWRDSVPVGQLV